MATRPRHSPYRVLKSSSTCFRSGRITSPWLSGEKRRLLSCPGGSTQLPSSCPAVAPRGTPSPQLCRLQAGPHSWAPPPEASPGGAESACESSMLPPSSGDVCYYCTVLLPGRARGSAISVSTLARPLSSPAVFLAGRAQSTGHAAGSPSLGSQDHQACLPPACRTCPNAGCRREGRNQGHGVVMGRGRR